MNQLACEQKKDLYKASLHWLVHFDRKAIARKKTWSNLLGRCMDSPSQPPKRWFGLPQAETDGVKVGFHYFEMQNGLRFKLIPVVWSAGTLIERQRGLLAGGGWLPWRAGPWFLLLFLCSIL